MIATASLLPQIDDRFWVTRPVESPGQRPLAFEDGENVLALLRRWPRRHGRVPGRFRSG